MIASVLKLTKLHATTFQHKRKERLGIKFFRKTNKRDIDNALKHPIESNLIKLQYLDKKGSGKKWITVKKTEMPDGIKKDMPQNTAQ